MMSKKWSILMSKKWSILMSKKWSFSDVKKVCFRMSKKCVFGSQKRPLVGGHPWGCFRRVEKMITFTTQNSLTIVVTSKLKSHILVSKNTVFGGQFWWFSCQERNFTPQDRFWSSKTEFDVKCWFWCPESHFLMSKVDFHFIGVLITKFWVLGSPKRPLTGGHPWGPLFRVQKWCFLTSKRWVLLRPILRSLLQPKTRWQSWLRVN